MPLTKKNMEACLCAIYNYVYMYFFIQYVYYSVCILLYIETLVFILKVYIK